VIERSSDHHYLLDDRRYGQPFLASHRAHAACSRELTRLADEIEQAVAALPGVDPQEKAVVRRSPDRCILQLGPVALTFAWLRAAHDPVTEGELLVIIWQGAVAPRVRHEPERPAKSAQGATPLWEEVLVAAADSEDTWAWQPRAADARSYSSAELAAHCAKRLGRAYREMAVA
jgi:hypothetical protein